MSSSVEIPPTRNQLRKLAKERLSDSKVLLDAGKYSGSYYICGYAVECGLKAIIAKNVKPNVFPAKDSTKRCYIHKLNQLSIEAGLGKSLELKQKTDPKFDSYWAETILWSEESRYTRKSKRDAEDLYIAVSDIDHGVLTWLANYW